MTIDFLLPSVAGLQLTSIIYEDKRLTLSLISTHPTVHCPVCGCSSEKIHSRYHRRVADLPWPDKQIQAALECKTVFLSGRGLQKEGIFRKTSPSYPSLGTQNEPAGSLPGNAGAKSRRRRGSLALSFT